MLGHDGFLPYSVQFVYLQTPFIFCPVCVSPDAFHILSSSCISRRLSIRR